jgi:uncharacterized protein with HEPN domain/predicted nucleotidyltransferase
MRRNEALRILDEHREELAREYSVASLDLFGSVGRDEAGPGSDIDLLVEFKGPPRLSGLIDLRERLEAVFGTKVDLVTSGGLRPWFRERIRREIESGGRLRMPSDWTGRVEDILDAVAKIERYTRGMTFDSFAANDLVADAVVRNIEIIGEAARHIPDEVRARYPGVPWARMNDMRNVVIHNYPNVDLAIDWEVIRDHLPPLVPIPRDVLKRERGAR